MIPAYKNTLHKSGFSYQYYNIGSKNLCLFVYGLGDNFSSFEGVVKHLQAIANIIVINLPGSG